MWVAGFGNAIRGNLSLIMTNRRDRDRNAGMAVLAVLAAAAREAEELLNDEPELTPEAVDEANRRLKLFMRTARQLAR